jgi:hypothetical protein
MHNSFYQLIVAFRCLLAGSMLPIILLQTTQTSQGCYVDGTISAASVEGSATAVPLPLANPQAVQPATIRIRAGANSSYTYSLTSVLSYWYGTRQSEDRLGITRTARQRYANNQYGNAVNLSVLAADSLSQNGLPATTGSATRSYGPYTPGNFTSTYYGVEYIYLTMVDMFGTFWLPEVTHNPIVTNPGSTVAVYVYPNTAQASFYDSTGKSLNGQTIQGTAPVITVKMSNMYPAGTSWVQFYNGPQTSSPTGVVTIPATVATAKATDLDSRNISVNLSTLIVTPGVWTVEVLQRTNVYADDHLSTPATFTLVDSVNVNTEFGTLK